MDIKAAIKILKDHNKWRTGSEEIKMANPRDITEAIDNVISFIDCKTAIMIEFSEFCSKYTFKHSDKKWYKKFPFANFPHYYTTLELYELFEQSGSENGL